MSSTNFIKQNFALVLGLALPALLMVFFLASTMIPQTLSDPPKYDLVFAVHDYPNNYQSPVNVKLIVKDGTLTAQYTKIAPNTPNYYYNGWKKLYLYNASTQKVRELTFGYPPEPEKIEGMREEPVEAAKGLKLSTEVESPDGYSLSHEGRSRSGLFNEIFWNGGYSSEARLRKGASSVKLMGPNDRTYYYGSIEFIGWVVP